MSGIATAIVASAVIGGVVSHQSSKKQAEATRDAANIQASTGDSQIDELRRQYDQLREDYEPFRQTGLQANQLYSDYLGGDLSGFIESPARQFQLEQGENALNRQASAQGRLNTGSQSKDLLRFSQGLADQSVNQYLNQLLVASGRGQAATGSVGAAGQALGTNTSNVLGNVGSAQAQNALLQGQLRGSTYQQYGNIAQNALNQYSQYQGYQNAQNQGPPAGYYSASQNPNVPGDAYAPAYGG